MSESLRRPQLEPADHCYVILQDHGSNDGGWGPAAVLWPGFDTPRPFVYTGNDATTLQAAEHFVQALAQQTGKPTLLARYTTREDIYRVAGPS